MMNKKLDVKGIIFDYGGTLDTRGDHWSEVLWKGYEHFGIGVNADEEVEPGVSIGKSSFRDAYVYGERVLGMSCILAGKDLRTLAVVLVVTAGIAAEPFWTLVIVLIRVIPETGLEPTMAMALAATVVKRKAMTATSRMARTAKSSTMPCRRPLIRQSFWQTWSSVWVIWA